MKFSHEESHVWQQFGLALACGRKDTRALLVLQEVHRLLPNEPHYCLLAAKVAFQQLGKVRLTMHSVSLATCFHSKAENAPKAREKRST